MSTEGEWMNCKGKKAKVSNARFPSTAGTKNDTFYLFSEFLT